MPPAITRRTWRGGAWTTWGYSEAAKLTTALAGANNDLTYTAKAKDASGNSIRVRYVVAGNSTPLSVAVSGNDITVNVATDAGGVATSTGNAVKAAVNGSTPASALVTASTPTGDTGAGAVTALPFTSLTGGRAGGIGTGSSSWRRVGPFGSNLR